MMGKMHTCFSDLDLRLDCVALCQTWPHLDCERITLTEIRPENEKASHPVKMS